MYSRPISFISVLLTLYHAPTTVFCDTVAEINTLLTIICYRGRVKIIIIQLFEDDIGKV